jgi:1-acyl-sn-glycerol-3-phosphate acyltransferase
MFDFIIHAIGRFLLTVIFGIPPVEKVPDGQCVVISNHNTHIDTMLLFRLFPLSRISRVKVAAAKDHFSKGFTGFSGRILFKLILLERHAKDSAAALDPIEEAIKEGFSVILFPEGTRGEPGVIQHFKSGIGKISMDFPELPIYPVYISGAEKTMPRGSILPVPFNIRLKVMPPVFGRDFIQHGDHARKKITQFLEELFLNEGAGSSC